MKGPVWVSSLPGTVQLSLWASLLLLMRLCWAYRLGPAPCRFLSQRPAVWTMATRQDWTFHRLAFPHSTAHAFPMMPLAIQPGFIPRRAPRTTFGTTEKHKRGRLLVLSHCVLHLCRPKCIFGQLFLNHPLFLWYPVQTLPLHPPVPTPTETHMLPFHPHTHCSDCSPLAMGQRPGYGGTVWDHIYCTGKEKWTHCVY